MNASVIVAHPYPRSFNHSIYGRIISNLGDLGIRVFAHDLYEENFHPVLTRTELGTDRSEDPMVNQYAAELLDSTLLFFVHPNWWGQPPAILKGYVDRVIRPPYAYDFPDDNTGGGLPVQKLGGRYGVVYNTANTAEDREKDYFGDPLENIWSRCVFGFCGIEKTHRRMFRIVADSTEDQRRIWLTEVDSDVRRIVGELE